MPRSFRPAGGEEARQELRAMDAVRRSKMGHAKEIYKSWSFPEYDSTPGHYLSHSV